MSVIPSGCLLILLKLSSSTAICSFDRFRCSIVFDAMSRTSFLSVRSGDSWEKNAGRAGLSGGAVRSGAERCAQDAAELSAGLGELGWRQCPCVCGRVCVEVLLLSTRTRHERSSPPIRALPNICAFTRTGDRLSPPRTCSASPFSKNQPHDSEVVGGKGHKVGED